MLAAADVSRSGGVAQRRPTAGGAERLCVWTRVKEATENKALMERISGSLPHS